jgi:hypothetical protein
MDRRMSAAVTVAVLVLAGGCTSSTTTTGPASAVAQSPVGSASAGVSSSGSTAASAPSASAVATGMCRTIDLAAATALLGGTPKQLAAPAGSAGSATKIDGCSYTGTDPALGYDVVRQSGPAKTFVEAAKAALNGQPNIVLFAVPLGDDGFGFTTSVGAKTMARIQVAKGNITVDVSSTATDPAKAQSVALEAAKRLVGAF